MRLPIVRGGSEAITSPTGAIVRSARCSVAAILPFDPEKAGRFLADLDRALDARGVTHRRIDGNAHDTIVPVPGEAIIIVGGPQVASVDADFYVAIGASTGPATLLLQRSLGGRLDATLFDARPAFADWLAARMVSRAAALMPIK